MAKKVYTGEYIHPGSGKYRANFERPPRQTGRPGRPGPKARSRAMGNRKGAADFAKKAAPYIQMLKDSNIGLGDLGILPVIPILGILLIGGGSILGVKAMGGLSKAGEKFMGAMEKVGRRTMAPIPFLGGAAITGLMSRKVLPKKYKKFGYIATAGLAGFGIYTFVAYDDDKAMVKKTKKAVLAANINNMLSGTPEFVFDTLQPYADRIKKVELTAGMRKEAADREEFPVKFRFDIEMSGTLEPVMIDIWAMGYDLKKDKVVGKVYLPFEKTYFIKNLKSGWNHSPEDEKGRHKVKPAKQPPKGSNAIMYRAVLFVDAKRIAPLTVGDAVKAGRTAGLKNWREVNDLVPIAYSNAVWFWEKDVAGYAREKGIA